MSKPIVIYHGNCADGYTGAWVFWRQFGDTAEYYPGKYQQEPPDVTGRDVYLVDFSYKRDVMERLLEKASMVVLLDHHKSAIEGLADLEHPTFFNRSDTAYSGAMLAWKYFYSVEPPPMLYHVQDRDLWKFELEGTRELSEFIFSHEYEFAIWDKIMSMTPNEVRAAIISGALVVKKHFKDIHELLKVSTRVMTIGGYDVQVANLSYMMASDAGNSLANSSPFGVTYYDGPESRHFSLRSTKTNPAWVDVSKIAEMYGGGGHLHASGFKVSRDHDLAKQ
jgi:oligoribonuclease NrnB/cAMP/cGMP phosphodiesterase (DHH superfamily)